MLNWEFCYPCGSFENWANQPWDSHLFPNLNVVLCVWMSQLALISCCHIDALSDVNHISYVKSAVFCEKSYINAKYYFIISITRRSPGFCDYLVFAITWLSQNINFVAIPKYFWKTKKLTLVHPPTHRVWATCDLKLSPIMKTCQI